MSNAKLKELNQQVIVVTGASSGIGLATAMLAAERGAKVVLAARSEDTLEAIVEEIIAEGGDAISIPCDVSDAEQVKQLVDQAITHYGRIDTWVNNAGASIYGRLDKVSEEDSRQLFDTNFWGVYHGALAVLPHLKKHGGALINLGSEVSESIVPYQGMYSASKHAVKGFIDALRVEVEELDHAPVAITLIQPTATNTPFPQHAKNEMTSEPKLPDPLDDPQDVAEAILAAATSPTRSKKVGAMSKVNTTIAKLLPKLGDKIAAKMAGKQHYAEKPRNPEGILTRASEFISGAGHVYGSGGKSPS
jgi:short-subunit dehydrogenase